MMPVQPGGGNRDLALDLRWDVDRNGTRSGHSVSVRFATPNR